MIRDYYAVLDLEINADYALIKQRYRQLVRENHPDIAVDKEAAHAKMQLILEAWKVLSDPSRRARYDNELAAYRGSSKQDMAPIGTYKSNATANTQPWEARPAPQSDSRDRSRSSSQPRTSYSTPRPSQNPRTKLLTMVFEAAQLYHKEGRVAEAITVCNRVMKADPTNVDAVVLLGDIYASQNRKDIALGMYERAMRLQPNNALYRQKWNQLRHGGAAGASDTSFAGEPDQPRRPAAPANTQTAHSVLFNSGPKRPGLNERLAGAEVTPPPLRRNKTEADTPAEASEDSAPTTAETVDEKEPVAAPDAETETVAQASVPEEPTMQAAVPNGAQEEEAASNGSFMDRFKARLKR